MGVMLTTNAEVRLPLRTVAIDPMTGPLRRNLDEVMCFKVSIWRKFVKLCDVEVFKCGIKGHYANHCRNRNVPGNRGGTERSKRFGEYSKFLHETRMESCLQEIKYGHTSGFGGAAWNIIHTKVSDVIGCSARVVQNGD
jgi:hypothetical protein